MNTDLQKGNWEFARRKDWISDFWKDVIGVLKIYFLVNKMKYPTGYIKSIITSNNFIISVIL